MESILYLRAPLRLWYADLGTLLHPDAELREREHPFGWERIVLLGSCHGILCVANMADGQVALWSPTTGNCNLLPPADARMDILGPTTCVYGFGYDNVHHEYVLLRVVQTLGSPIVSAVSIYRSRADAWRWLDRILPYYLDEPGRMGVYAHNRLHWIMRYQQNCMSAKVLVAFEFDTNSFVKVSLPKDLRGHNIDRRHHMDLFGMDLAVLGEQLCLTTICSEPWVEPGVVDVWIMREYGLNQTWHPLFSLYNHGWCFRPIRPLAYSDSRVLVEVGSRIKTLSWYNLNTREVEQFQLNGMPRNFDEATCLSLQG